MVERDFFNQDNTAADNAASTASDGLCGGALQQIVHSPEYTHITTPEHAAYIYAHGRAQTDASAGENLPPYPAKFTYVSNKIYIRIRQNLYTYLTKFSYVSNEICIRIQQNLPARPTKRTCVSAKICGRMGNNRRSFRRKSA
jgi:hypothetical protein